MSISPGRSVGPLTTHTEPIGWLPEHQPPCQGASLVTGVGLLNAVQLAFTAEISFLLSLLGHDAL